MKRKLLLLLIPFILCGIPSFAHDIQVGGIYYDFINNRTELSVTYKGEKIVFYGREKSSFYSAARVVIPRSVTYKGRIYKVTSIGEEAFFGCEGLTSIIIPNSVTSIGRRAFKDCSLRSITIPNSVTNIGGEAFRNCDNLISITIPNSVTGIKSWTFFDCTSLRSITIPKSVRGIGSGAFEGCKSLTSITIPNSVTSIGGGAFGGCTNLLSIRVNEGNPKYDSRDNCTAIIETNSNTLIAGCKNTTIPNSVTSIGESAFSHCAGLTSITIPNSVTSIGDYAFRGCENLTSITIPNSVTSIGYHTFDETPWLDNQPDGLIYIGRVAYKYKGEMPYGTSITIKEGTTAIMNFESCKGLKSITIPNSVTSIGNDAFSGCTNLTSINIPNSVTSIGNDAFNGCENLSSINIPNSVTSIGWDAFDGTAWLDNQPDGVVYAGRFFYEYKGEMSYGTSWFDNQPDGLVYVGRIAYKYKGEMPYETTITIKEGTTAILDGCFENCTGLKSINIPNSVTSVGKAFSGCENLTSITIPNSITFIGDVFCHEGSQQSMFNGFGNDLCSLTSITIPKSVETIGWEAIDFDGLYNLKDLYIYNETPPGYIETAWDGTPCSIPKSCTLHVPKGCKEIYENEEPWCYCAKIVDDL